MALLNMPLFVNGLYILFLHRTSLADRLQQSFDYIIAFLLVLCTRWQSIMRYVFICTT